MLRAFSRIEGAKVQAEGETLGRVRDVFFDDRHWRARYFVVDVGSYLSGRRVLVSPLAVGEPDWESGLLPVRLSRQQIEASPPVDARLPVSRRSEEALAAHYGWAQYWGRIAAGGFNPREPLDEGPAAAETGEAGHLRSVAEVIGYTLATEDREVGVVEDLLLGTTKWRVRYLVANTRRWLRGRRVLLAPAWVKQFHWAKRHIHVALNTHEIENSPELEPDSPITEAYEKRLRKHYGRE